MVYLQKAKWCGLYSFKDTCEIDLSEHVIVVGPNNSGKSNVLRILKVFVDAFADHERLSSSKIYLSERNPFLEISLQFSESETRNIVDFFSFHPDNQNNASEFYEFKNYDLLLELFDTAIIRLEWRKAIEGEPVEPYLKIKFPKTGIKFFSYLFSDFCISNSFPETHGEKKYNNGIFFKDLLKKIKDKDSILSTVNEFYSHDYNEIGSLRIKINDLKKLTDKAQITLTNLFLFLGVPLIEQRDIRFVQLLGTILQNGIKISSGSKGLTTKSILDMGQKLKTSHRELLTTIQGDEVSFNTVLERQIFEKLLDFNWNLESDGNNLVSFLFSLKNSSRQNDRTKFKNIQEEFVKLFESDKLSFDVILQYKLPERNRMLDVASDTVPKIPTIMIQDENLQMQFSTDQVGSGLLEIIYLLTLAHGLNDSVILLDESAVNLHPTLMKSIIKSLQNPDRRNQFIIVTHSAELASYEIFDTRASIVYIRKKNNQSIVKILEDKTKEWFTQDRHRLKHQIDSRIFFGKSVLLCEGDSDKNLLEGIANSLEYTNSKINIAQNDVIITHVGGKNNFKKYMDLMINFDIPYLVLGDSDARVLFKNSGNMTKKEITFEDNITIIENKSLEELMKDIDLDTYHNSKKEYGDSKPAVAFAFAEEISKNNPEKLEVIQKLLLKSVELAKN